MSDLTEQASWDDVPQRKPDRKLSEDKILERRALDLWQEQGGAYASMRDFCDALGPSNGFDWKWAKARMNPKCQFGREAKEIKENRGKTPDEESRAPLLAPIRWPDLEPWKGLFIERYRETGSREKAWLMVNKTWAEIKMDLEMDEAFASACEEVDEEQVVKAEDAAVALATKGKGGASAQAVMETQSKRFSKMNARAQNNAPISSGRLTDYDVEETRQRAKEMYQRLLSVVPPRGNDVEEPSGPDLAAS